MLFSVFLAGLCYAPEATPEEQLQLNGEKEEYELVSCIGAPEIDINEGKFGIYFDSLCDAEGIDVLLAFNNVALQQTVNITTGENEVHLECTDIQNDQVQACYKVLDETDINDLVATLTIDGEMYTINFGDDEVAQCEEGEECFDEFLEPDLLDEDEIPDDAEMVEMLIEMLEEDDMKDEV